MARRVVRSEEHYGSVTAKAFADWAGEPKAKAEPKKKARSMWDRGLARDDVSHFISSRDWSKARPQHFVELYSRLHFEVYGVEPLDLKAKAACLAAASLAAKALREFFRGDPNGLADFMRWVWIRQATEEKKRRAGLKENDFRITWRYQWSAKLVTDFQRSVLTAKTEKRA